MIPTPGKGFYKAEAAIKTLNTKKNSKCSSLDRFEILPSFWGPDIVLFSEKNPWNFKSVFVPLEIPEKTSFLEILQSCVTHRDWKFQDQKLRPIEIQHEFFLSTLGNSTSLFHWHLPLEFQYHAQLSFFNATPKFHFLSSCCFLDFSQ